MLKRIRLYAMSGLLLSLFQFGTLLWGILSEGWSFWLLIPALLIIGAQAWTSWRLWHLRRWAAIAGIVIGAWFSLSLFAYPLLLLPLLCFTVYTGFTIRQAWPQLLSGR